MKNLFVAVRIDGSTDAIIFNSLSDCDRFCELHNEYEKIETGIYTLSAALDLFGE